MPSASSSTSISRPTAPRPIPKRAVNTWPGTTASRNHFEDFLREIGACTESTHLCCIPKVATTHPHVHTSQRSTSNVRSKARSSPSRTTHSRVHLRDASIEESPALTRTKPLPAEGRGRSLSSARVSGTLTSGLPISPKSPALSSINLENHDATAAYDYFPSAHDHLITVIGHPNLEGRPSRALTRASPKPPQSTSRSPDPQGMSRPSSSSPSSSRSRELEPHSRTRSAGRSSSRTPSIDSLDTASSSEAPATPKTQSMLVHDLPPVSTSPLEELERSSRFRVQCVCMTCKRAGSNFPHCGKCGDMWCSRECRTGAAGTHVCHGRIVRAAQDSRVLQAHPATFVVV
ncbi:hypothetical protein BD311DRAFT_318243 [Dichomitus squalens]|uniref:HIT-type domain-containing protein n=1 Tax=Dichomitus squalens TaxID=114155 RepID=A0A4Q9MLS9_9APHY|nr:hypothetical protein BD311DRAFT_318243 [Dichomitus squalens]